MLRLCIYLHFSKTVIIKDTLNFSLVKYLHIPCGLCGKFQVFGTLWKTKSADVFLGTYGLC